MIKLHSLRATKFKQLDDVGILFPERGSVLIQGLNEAGKSTLFESIYFGLFGKGLSTEDNSGRLDDLINYQSPRGMVQLAFSTDNATFTVRRLLNRARANSAMLDVAYRGGKREQVTNLTSVNRRIAEELGLDGEALLNSCFVEQKKLEKLEGMSAQQRRDTLLRLLNLDKLSSLEAQWKPTPADEVELRRQRDRLALAEVQRDLPAVRQRLWQIDQDLRAITARKLLDRMNAIEAGLAEERLRQGDLGRQEVAVRGHLEQVDRLKDVRAVARSAGEALAGIAQDREDLARLDRELAEAEGQAALLPEIGARAVTLQETAALLARLDRRQQEAGDLRQRLERANEAAERLRVAERSIAGRQASLAELDSAVAEAEAAVRQVEATERQQARGQLLRSWLQIREVASAAGESERQLAELQQAAGDIRRRADQQVAGHRAARRTAVGAGIAAGVLVLAGVASTVVGVFAGLVALPLALLAGIAAVRAGLAASKQRAAIAGSQAALAGCQAELNRKEGERDLARRSGQDPRRVEEIETGLADLGFPVPTSLEQAHDWLAEIDQSRGEVAGNAARQRLGSLSGQRQALAGELRNLQSQVALAGDPLADARQVEASLAEAEADIAGVNRRLGPEVADLATVSRDLGRLKAEEQVAGDAGQRIDGLHASRAQRLAKLAVREAEADTLVAQLAGLDPDLTPGLEGCRAAWGRAGEALAQLDEPQLRGEMSRLADDLAASRERQRAGGRERDSLAGELEKLSVSDEMATAVNVESELPLREEYEDLVGRAAALADRLAGLETQLQLQGVALDYDDTVVATRELERRCQVKAQAYRIVALARKNIVAKVLPSTVRNMRLLLPLLTNDRYRDVDISDDYKIRVWDDSAQALKAKDIFSGGTRDQFSLALRLAFALATLPEELGTAPGFIFLDEPLSSFDQARGEALVALLTNGLIAANFQQIFVISHNRSFDERLFDYHVHLEGGRILSSDLPELQPEAPAVQQGKLLAAAPA
ncbi:MAG: AAA family ATPase [Chloroflexota bacterium]